MTTYRSHRRNQSLLVLALVACIASSCFAQEAKLPASYPTRLPYAFGNFPWWTDSDLRAELKRRIPGLGDQIAPNQQSESRLRNALKELLHQKGIVADVMSEDPSPWSLTAQTVPGAPPPAIVFSILNPAVLIGKVTVSGVPNSIAAETDRAIGQPTGREYSSRNDWLLRDQLNYPLGHNGYLDARIAIDHGPPQASGDHFLVDLAISVEPGPQYHIASITGDGGPLLQGRNIATLFRPKPGDVAQPEPRSDLSGSLLVLYERYGYADASADCPPVVDREHATVSYHCTVNAGPQYHLRTLVINHLDAGQESKVRRLLALAPGDLYNVLAVNALYHLIAQDSSLNGYDFTFSPQKDPSSANVTLTLDFHKKSETPQVTAH